jgi:quercetin dioxygenase-like cupin family protein
MLSAHFQLAGLDSQRLESRRSYLEFLRAESLSLGLYVLQPGEQDLQQPHGQDEVYYVIKGRARFTAGAEQWSVEAGSVLSVAAGVAHRFHEIEEELQVLVLFAPPEDSGPSA